MKYRIVRRPGKTYCYYAQKKVLWFWVDLPSHSLSSWKDKPPCETPSHSLKLVEDYIEHVAQKEVVVKKYD